MKTLSFKQLAFILDIEPIEALHKIIFVHCKLQAIAVPRKSHLVRDYIYKDTPWPIEYSTATLSEQLNLPNLEMAVHDIQENYLKRQGTKKYILFDYPEKELKTKLKDQVKVPTVLASLLKPEDVEFIKSEWHRRYGITDGKLVKAHV